MEKEQHRPLADRRAGQGGPTEDEEPDFAEERTPSPSDPPRARAEARGTTRRGLLDRIRSLFS
jgi:hypothetical protein